MKARGRFAAGVGAALLFMGALLLPVALSSRPPHIAATAPVLDGAPQERLSEQKLLDGVILEQDLGAVPDGLSEVDIYVNSWGHPHLATLHLEVLDAGSGAIVATTSIAGQDPREEIAYFPFRPIADSGERRLRVRLTAPGAVDQTSISPDVVRHPGPGAASLQVGGLPIDATLPLRLRTGAAAPAFAQVGDIVARASQYHPWPFKGAPLAVVALAALLTAALVPLGIALTPGQA